MAIYTALNEQDKDIRVLSLHAGSGAELIRCSLHIVSLQNHPEYEALSYVWGPREPCQFIDIDGQPFGVTPNLYAALRGLRLAALSRSLWVDAVCITQGENAEKASQAAMMGAIYSGTREALLGLGEKTASPIPAVSPA